MLLRAPRPEPPSRRMLTLSGHCSRECYRAISIVKLIYARRCVGSGTVPLTLLCDSQGVRWLRSCGMSRSLRCDEEQVPSGEGQGRLIAGIAWGCPSVSR